MKRILMLLSLSALLLLAACGDSPASVDTPADADTSAGTDAPDGAASDSATDDIPGVSEEALALYNDTATKDELKSNVESVISDDYKGLAYSCDILVHTDDPEPRYVASIQIDVDAEPPESTDIIKSIEDAVVALGDNRIAAVEIDAFRDMKYVDSNKDVDPSLFTGRSAS